jgi:hypothetical protein
VCVKSAISLSSAGGSASTCPNTATNRPEVAYVLNVGSFGMTGSCLYVPVCKWAKAVPHVLYVVLVGARQRMNT